MGEAAKEAGESAWRQSAANAKARVALLEADLAACSLAATQEVVSAEAQVAALVADLLSERRLRADAEAEAIGDRVRGARAEASAAAKRLAKELGVRAQFQAKLESWYGRTNGHCAFLLLKCFWCKSVSLFLLLLVLSLPCCPVRNPDSACRRHRKYVPAHRGPAAARASGFAPPGRGPRQRRAPGGGRGDAFRVAATGASSEHQTMKEETAKNFARPSSEISTSAGDCARV